MLHKTFTMSDGTQVEVLETNAGGVIKYHFLSNKPGSTPSSFFWTPGDVHEQSEKPTVEQAMLINQFRKNEGI